MDGENASGNRCRRTRGVDDRFLPLGLVTGGGDGAGAGAGVEVSGPLLAVAEDKFVDCEIGRVPGCGVGTDEAGGGDTS